MRPRLVLLVAIAIGCGQDAPPIDAAPPPSAPSGCTAHEQCPSLACLQPDELAPGECIDEAEVSYVSTEPGPSGSWGDDCNRQYPCFAVQDATRLRRRVVRIMSESLLVQEVRIERPTILLGGPGRGVLGFAPFGQPPVPLFTATADLEVHQLRIWCDTRANQVGVQVSTSVSSVLFDRVEFRDCLGAGMLVLPVRLGRLEVRP